MHTCFFVLSATTKCTLSFYLMFFCQEHFPSGHIDSLFILLLQFFAQTSCPQYCFHGYSILNMTNLTLQIFSISLSCHIFVLNNTLYNLGCYRLYVFLLFICSLLILESTFHGGRYFLCALH